VRGDGCGAKRPKSSGDGVEDTTVLVVLGVGGLPPPRIPDVPWVRRPSLPEDLPCSPKAKRTLPPGVTTAFHPPVRWGLGEPPPRCLPQARAEAVTENLPEAAIVRSAKGTTHPARPSPYQHTPLPSPTRRAGGESQVRPLWSPATRLRPPRPRGQGSASSAWVQPSGVRGKPGPPAHSGGGCPGRRGQGAPGLAKTPDMAARVPALPPFSEGVWGGRCPE